MGKGNKENEKTEVKWTGWKTKTKGREPRKDASLDKGKKRNQTEQERQRKKGRGSKCLGKEREE